MGIQDRSRWIALAILLSARLACAADAGPDAPPATVLVQHVKVDKGFYVIGGVNIRNGNFSVSYSHFDQVPGLDVVKTYNSRSSAKGLFGQGWGSPLETRLAVMPEGTVIIRENGTGALTVYGSPEWGGIGLAGEQIANVVKEARHLSDDDYQQLRKDLVYDQHVRFEKVLEFGIQTARPKGRLAVDRFVSTSGNSCQVAYVEFDKGKFWRTCDSTLESFTPEGRIIRRYDAALGKYSVLTYRGGAPALMEIGEHRIEFAMEGGHTTRMVADGGDSVAFTYDASGNLVKQAWSTGNTITFGYDSKSNLTSIGYIDNSKQTMTYNAASQTTSVTQRDGQGYTYEYSTDPKDSHRDLTLVTGRDAKGQVIGIVEFEMRTDGLN
jgi:YD repeat-containing protein